jgi:flagellum-specific ATP synthase
MEGDDQQDPLVDAVRAILDGHIMLDRKLAAQGHYPPIGILDSISRLMPAVCSVQHMSKAQRLRSLLSSYAASEDLIRVGAYHKGGDATLDQAIAALPALNAFLCQKKDDLAPLTPTIQSLLALPG